MSANAVCKEKNVSVTSLALSDTNLNLAEGDEKILTATVFPDNATNKNVTWKSGNTNIATVKNGVVRAVGAGTTKITVTSADGLVSAVCNVTVSKKVIAVTGISLNNNAITMSEGEKQTLTASVLPLNATDKSIRWTSSNTKVAKVSNGTVTAVGSGTAVITAETAVGNKKAECRVKVVKIVTDVNSKFIVAKASGVTGSEVTVDVSIKDNPGIAALKVMLEYPDDILTLKSVEYPELFSSKGTGGDKYKNPFVMSWFSIQSQNETANGVFARVTFKVKEDAPAGTYAVRLKYDAENVINIAGDKVSFGVENGEITINASRPGDVNGDKLVNMKDLVVLQQKLNGWDKIIDELAADVNKDGILNMKDIVLLQQYMNGLDVSLK